MAEGKARKLNKRGFTLIEMVSVFFLISLIGGLFSWNFYEKYKRDLFDTEKKKLKKWVHMLQLIATYHREDVICTFSFDKKTGEARAGFLEGKGFLSKKPSKKETFQVEIFFNQKRGPFTLYISSTGKISPSGEIFLYLDKKRQKTIKTEDLYRFKEEVCDKDFFAEK